MRRSFGRCLSRFYERERNAVYVIILLIDILPDWPKVVQEVVLFMMRWQIIFADNLTLSS
jgi:hypothetical protein